MVDKIEPTAQDFDMPARLFRGKYVFIDDHTAPFHIPGQRQ
jgi:hypothetical protein